MNSTIIDPTLQGYKDAIAQLLAEIRTFAQNIDNGALTKTVQSLQENLSQPFLFVVIGEVKAGKSSFINALLNSGEICEVGADPRTNLVAKVVHAEGKGYSRELKPGELREIGRPVPILEKIAIVDTPGTNSPFQRHEDITKEFIPNSDLVVFVFFSKNPYTNTAWSLVDFAHKDWKKPVVFVLQQSDLADDRELQASLSYIEQEAQQRQIPNPQVFATSAKQTINGADGGFTPLQDFIRSTITGGKGYQLKLASSIGSAEQILKRLDRNMQLLQQQLKADEAVVENVQRRLGQGQFQSRSEIDALVERLMTQYERVIYQIKSEFRDELSIPTLAKRSFFSMFNRKQRIDAWIAELNARAQAELEETLDETSKEGAKRFLNSIQLLIKQLVSELDALQNNHLKRSEFALPIVDYRDEVIEGVKSKITKLLNDKAFIDCFADTADSVGPSVASGSIVAIVGGIIMRATSIVIIDVLAGVFLWAGVLFAGGSLFAKRRELIQKLDSELERNRDHFEYTVSEQLNAKLSVIYEEIDRSFSDLYSHVEQERRTITPLLSKFEQIKQSTNSLAKEINRL